MKIFFLKHILPITFITGACFLFLGGREWTWGLFGSWAVIVALFTFADVSRDSAIIAEIEEEIEEEIEKNKKRHNDFMEGN